LQKFCSQTSLSFDALQPRPVKNPAVAFSHGQDPQLPSRDASIARQQ
jgi:hypothetical protein